MTRLERESRTLIIAAGWTKTPPHSPLRPAGTSGTHILSRTSLSTQNRPAPSGAATSGAYTLSPLWY